MKAKQKKIEITNSDLVKVEPITDNQKLVFNSYKKGQNQFLFGAAGTGKTFISLYLALKDVMDLKKPYDKVILVRSLIPTREIGFLPGDEEDKAALYQVPYQNMVQFMFEQSSDNAFSMLYDRLKNQGSITFLTTSYLRGITLDNAIVIVDESQNCNFHELDTIITDDNYSNNFDRLNTILYTVSISLSIIPRDVVATFNGENGRFKKYKQVNYE